MGRQQNSSIQVVCRFRPLDSLEIELGTENVVEIVDNNVASIQHPGQKTYRFDFDYVFGGKTRQEEIFERTAAPMIEEILQGYNSTVFVYGQTGSGKTFTMQGNAGNQGLIPRTVDRLFQLIMSCTDQVEFTIKVSYLEIYLEKIRDLLDITRENLRIRESPSGMWVEGATETYVSSSSELLGLMTDGIANRVFSSTRMNLESSRSHAIFVIAVHQLDRVTKSKKHAKLLLVDLAGSEKVEKTEAWGTALKEAQNINKSLSALGNVINALTTNSSHVPYRDSKLTKLLTDSLGGNSLCCLIICCSPSLYNAVETITTCRFGQRAKLIQNKAKINQERSLPEYKMLLEEAERKIEQQAEIIARLETPLSLNATIPDENLQLSQKQIDGFRTSITNSSGNENKIRPHRISIAAGSALNVMQEKILNLEKELLQNRDESEGLRDQISDKQSEIEMLRESIDDVYNQILMCKVKLDEAEQRNKQSCDENVALQAQILKSNFELEQQKFRAEEAEHDIVSFYDQRRARFEGTDTWTKQFKPNPVVDEHLSETKKIKLITKQYVALFHEFSDQVGKIAELQEANSNLKEEAYAYRQLLEQENIDEDTRQLLSKRAVAENQSAKLVAENFQLKRIEQEQAKLLDSWKSKMAELETALDTMLTLNRKRNDQADSMITELKQEIDAYKAALQHRRDTVNMIAPAHIHKPIVGGIKTERTATVQDVLAEKKSYRPEETVADETKSSNADETKSSNADETKSSNADINDDPFLVEDFED